MNQENAMQTWGAFALVVLAASGLAWAGSQGGALVYGMPLFALAVAFAFVINWLAFIPAWRQRTEKFFDLMGGITFISTIALALLLTPQRDARTWLLAAMVSVWALRLSLFLFWRIRKTGEDTRFRELKASFARFLLTWTLQGLWTAVTLAPALAAITAPRGNGLDGWAWCGLVVWAVGFLIETVADWQKSRFKANPAHADAFIQEGLWAWSRHPNYFGEIVLWIGVTLVTLPTLDGWRWLTLVSPLFVILLLTRVSGIPLLEAHADAKWGGQADYEAYKARTPVLIPRPPKSKPRNNSHS